MKVQWVWQKESKSPRLWVRKAIKALILTFLTENKPTIYFFLKIHWSSGIKIFHDTPLHRCTGTFPGISAHDYLSLIMVSHHTNHTKSGTWCCYGQLGNLIGPEYEQFGIINNHNMIRQESSKILPNVNIFPNAAIYLTCLKKRPLIIKW